MSKSSIEAELDSQVFRLFTISQHSGWKPNQRNNDNQFTIIKHFYANARQSQNDQTTPRIRQNRPTDSRLNAQISCDLYSMQLHQLVDL
jgi:hypothetical protein